MGLDLFCCRYHVLRHSQHAQQRLSWSAGGVKDAMLVLNLLLQTINMGMGAQSSYNMAMTVKDDSTATSLVQAKAGIPEMLGLVSSLLLRLYSAGIDTANAFAGEPAGAAQLHDFVCGRASA